jgi:hypothetical protein
MPPSVVDLVAAYPPPLLEKPSVVAPPCMTNAPHAVLVAKKPARFVTTGGGKATSACTIFRAPVVALTAREVKR